MNNSKTSPLDSHIDRIRLLAERGVSYTEIAAILAAEFDISTSRDSVRRAVKRHDITVNPTRPPSLTMSSKNEAVVSGGDPAGDEISPDELMRKHGLDPEDWEIKDLIVNKWDAMMGEKHGNASKPMYQLKLFLVRKKPIDTILPARSDGAYIAPSRSAPSRGVRSFLIYGDQQAPFVNYDMFEAILRLCKKHRPTDIIDPGDGRDFPSVSVHKTWPKWKAEAQKCIDSKYVLDREMRQANEDARIVQILGNHDIRMADYVLKNAPEVYGIRPAAAPDEDKMREVLSIRNLGRLDELGIELLTDEKDAYDQTRFMLSHLLGVEHGNRAGKDPAIKAGQRLRFSIAIGHTHGQSVNHTTEYDHLGQPHVRVFAESGTGCLIDRGLGYTPNPNWINGGLWFTTHDDGQFHIELITYKDGRLYFRDDRF